VLDAVFAFGPPFQGLSAAGLEMEAELAVFVLRDLDSRDGVLLEQNTLPGLQCPAVLGRGQERNDTVFPEDGDSV
jgi:hypothetical protein